ncbi:c-type cytochrome [Marinilongibacter aquaticus]|uniref:HEAT repeat domain-containing protein n=1 Tax=Marinilongibacter aquaticus TaxID=2975157 RepID=UPI0021BD854E|nr:HEAT repeat domain-containing protein [Marinilongibacter aquaticus]UBM59925.1 c-type cytochrome [Marinilongibacter aquaticus]
MKNKLLKLGYGVLGGAVLWSCMKVASKSSALTTILAGEDDKAYAEQIETETSVKLADGLKIDLWATDSLAPDPIAMSIDDYNNIYLTRTNRQKNSEFDIRGHRDWMTESMSWQSVEDRRAFLHRFFDPKNSEKNDWLKDLNGDGSHDWRDLAVEQEEIWKLEDTDGDGRADKSTQVLRDFHDEITDVAGALLIRRHDAFVGLGPDLWRLEDTNQDGYYDKKTSIAHGFNVHVGFSGHGMSGLIEGPDGKIYWGIGDPGINIVDLAGNKHFFPNQGVIVRCNPDGSDFEVFSHGHRNTHEFVFDQYGNIISSDNDGDHRGESERLVHIVEGGDSGWRINWQFGKYTDSKNNGYKVWMDEEMYKPRHDGQAAYFLPPIRNYHNGPTGMQFNPGTALGKNWLNKFFLVEFTGSPSRAHIWSFDLNPKGASFDFKSEVDMVNGILATGIRFGTDGALYAADWINGWGTKNYGRVWKVDVKSNEFAEARAKTKALMASDFEKKSANELYDLLFYGDQRIRQKAQFELVNRGEGSALLTKAAQQTENQLARVHAIWGMGQLMAKKKMGDEVLISLLKDSDSEIVAQSAKVLGDVRDANAGSALNTLLNSSNPRVQFYGAQALGRIAYKPAVSGLIEVLKKNHDEDNYIRHAATLALARIDDRVPIHALINNSDKSLRLAAVLVMRKWQDPELAKSLKDKDEYIVAEAARAINDDFSVPEALPALAGLLNNPEIQSEVIMRRAINAALRVGGDAQLNALVAYAKNPKASNVLRAEALATVAVWADPSILDRVDGRLRGKVTRDAEKVRALLIPQMAGFLDSNDPAIVNSALNVLKELEIRGFNNKLVGIYQSSKDSETRSATLSTLAELDYPEIGNLINEALKSDDRALRTTALGMLNKLDISADLLPKMVNNVLDNGSQSEKQKMLESLGQMPLAKTEPVFKSLIAKLKGKELPNELRLDLADAIEQSGSDALAAELEAAVPKGDIFEEYADVLYGGDRRNGYRYFTQNESGQCIRCHSIGGNGGTVGPDLSDIGNVLERKQLLQALLEPSARLSPGFGTVTVTLKDGQEVTGVLEKENEEELIVRTSDAEPMEIAVSRISKRENYPSGMPPMGSIMNRHEMRDVIEFLSNLKK